MEGVLEGAEQGFVEKMGLLFETDGLPRIAGRMLGRLLLSEDSMSLDDLADGLRVSKASVSTNGRLLERMGALERVSRPGDRRDYYRVAAGLPGRILEMRLERVVRLRTMVGQVLGELGSAAPSVRERLEELEAFHRQVEADLEAALERCRGGSGGRERLRAAG
jgi:DNA-binding transcriptional regulator GbsR (MarR family)